MKYLVSKEALREFLEEDMPSRKSLQKDFMNVNPGKHNEVYAESVKHAIFEYQFHGFSEINALFERELTPYILGIKKGDIETVAKQVALRVSEILQAQKLKNN